MTKIQGSAGLHVCGLSFEKEEGGIGFGMYLHQTIMLGRCINGFIIVELCNIGQYHRPESRAYDHSVQFHDRLTRSVSPVLVVVVHF